MNVNRNNILLVGIVVEAFLSLIFFVWAYLKDIYFPLAPTMQEMEAAVLCVIPLIALNAILFGPLSQSLRILRPFVYLRDEIVKPLADELGPFSALVIACCAGVGEELFFRGLMQMELGILTTNILFALLHFGTAVRRFFLVALSYFVIGLYFSYVSIKYDSLWVPIVTHAIYDYLIIMFMRYYYKK